MEKYYPVLSKCPMFRDISKENLMAMLGCLGGKIEKYKKEERIFSEGEPAKWIGIVLSGMAQIVRIDYYGNRSIVAKIEPSDLFGEAFACAGTEALPVDVVSAGNTEILRMDAAKIIRTCNNACDFHRQIIFNLLQAVAAKNLILNQKMDILSKRSTREKLMAYLLSQAKENGSSSFEIPFDRQGLADYLGVDRSGLSTEIGKLRKEKVLECERSRFRLL